MRNFFILGCGASLLALIAATAFAQPRVRFPTATPASSPTVAFQGGGAQLNPITPIQPGAPGVYTVPGSTTTLPSAAFGSPSGSFDAFAANPGVSGSAPALLAPQSSTPLPAGYGGYGQPVYGQAFSNPVIAQQPPVMYPNGYAAPAAMPAQGWGPAEMFSSPTNGPYLRLFQDLRLEHSYITGDPEANGNDLAINDSEISTTVNFPNFLWSDQPLRISPAFALHLWSGPAGTAADLPSKAYSAFVNTAWASNPANRFGAEVDFSVGVFSDFNSLTVDSVRYFGTGLGTFKITPNLTLKAGVTYLDRVDIKLLPAGGLFWRPNADVYWEIYFPRPKFANRITTWGNHDIWIYLAAEYGGGSWTIERTSGASQQVDINDIRVYGGLEWYSHVTSFKGFVEVGYVFERELVYDLAPADNLELRDAIMVRGGIAY